jgi:hypothetical protein
MKVLQTTVITLLFMGLFSTSFADSIETMGGGIYHKENPLVCIMEPEPELQERFYDELLLLAYDSVMLWQNNLKSYTGGNWYMVMELVPHEKHFDKMVYDFPRCNIFIEFSKDNYGQHIDNVDALGYAQVDFSKSRHQWAYIMIYTEAVEKGTKISLCIGCDSKQEMDMTTKQEMLEMDSDAIKKVLIHELGHGLGIGHYVQDLRTDNNIESLMYPNFNPFSNKNEIEEIPLADLEVLRQIYESDGFGGLRGLHMKEIPMEDILFGIIENMSERCPTCTVQVGDD